MSTKNRGFANKVVLLSALGATALAMLFGLSTPARYVESLSYDLRVAFAAPPARDDLVIVKIDDRALQDMRAQSPCGCISPIDKVWLARVIAALDRHGARLIGVDYLFDTWRSREEFAAVTQFFSALKTPVVVVANPALDPDRDYPRLAAAHYADARVLVRDDYGDVVRRYDADPRGRFPAFAVAIARQLGIDARGRGQFLLRFRSPHPAARNENAGAIAPSFSAADVELLPADFFADKIVFIGRVTRSAGVDADTVLEDMHVTPLQYLRGHFDGTPGVEVHAHALSQLLGADTIRIPPDSSSPCSLSAPHSPAQHSAARCRAG